VEFYLILPLYSFEAWLGTILCCNAQCLILRRNYINVFLYFKIKKKYLSLSDSCHIIGKGKDKAVPLQDWTGPEGSRKLRLPDCVTTAQDGGKVVSLTHRPPLPPISVRG